MSIKKKSRPLDELFKQAARRMVALAVPLEILLKPTRCEFCRRKRPLEAHHHDDTKPLEVAWFCAECHEIVHAIARGNTVIWSPYEARVLPQSVVRARDRAIERFRNNPDKFMARVARGE